MSNPPDLPPLDLKGLLRAHDIHPKKSLGQNFLVSEAALTRVVDAADISKDDEVLEIGAGLGGLTRHLAQKAGRVVGVELDGRLIPILQDVLSEYDHVELLHRDILGISMEEIFTEPGYLVVSNIPYYITSAIMRHLMESQIRPGRMVLTVQKEVAERICAGPGDMSLLALSVQIFGDPSIRARIPAGAFFPAPKVDSGVVRVDLHAEPLADRATIDQVFRLAHAGFSQKRKTLRNSLSSGLGWPKDQTERLCREAGIDPGRRAETLSIEEWIDLAGTF
ncbi:MAG: 16S rRNA (adenine(1518)-N(6)/adenine(1519)-N(6))-dimethyltransferase RsmA [Anaerolineales bacterium]|nr:16S rRNA (adenine(1518)-N(6)/adenine(1519)-N(6))-dimethyltransferase RsmA [Anaerolineales bacterium]